MIDRLVCSVCVLLVLTCGVAAIAGNRTIDELWGSRLTVRQLLSQTAPELLTVFPTESLSQRVLWGADRGRACFTGTEGTKIPLEYLPPIDWMLGRNVVQVDVNEFDFWAFNSTSISIPYSQVVAYLQEDGRNIDSDSSAGVNSDFEMAYDYNTNCDGIYYRTVSYHWLTFPPS